jgi:hypothetical protein
MTARLRQALLLGALLLVPAEGRAQEPVELVVGRGPVSGEVTLAWSGGEPTFELYRSEDPADLVSPSKEIGETVRRDWIDAPPAGETFFYRVGTRAPTHAETIAVELLRPNDDPVGRPLPVAAHWNPGRASASQPGWDPDFVLDSLDAGEYVIPLFAIDMPLDTPEPWSYYESALQRARAHNLPFALRYTQWDRPFTDDPKYSGLPPAENPNVLDAADGTTVVPMTDPEGPLAPWSQVGAEWGSLPVIADMQEAYPQPPLVIWLNNFEQPRLRWENAHDSWRFVEAHGLETSDDEKRLIVGEGWIERDGALWAALHSRLGSAWRSTSIPVNYSAFGRHGYGSWINWDRKSLHVPGRFSPWPLVVNGSPSYYVFGDASVHNETDYQVSGPQVKGMNWLFMLEEAYRDSPDYFWEISIYDGGVQRHAWYRYIQGQVYDPDRYLGYVRYALWLARPRIAREFRLSREDREPYLEYWQVFLDAVAEVHEQDVLTRFWRKGRLLVNDAYPHPYQKKLYPGYTDEDVDRNVLLETSRHPPRPWNNATEIPVWALALELGEAPSREWLRFAYAPLADEPGVTITVPGYGDATVDVPRGTGRFWLFDE